MSRAFALLILFIAAVLEAGGDAIVRTGLQQSSSLLRLLIMLAGGVVLFLYGWTVNAPPWDFGKLIGIYVVFFFVIAQIISWVFFKQHPTPALLIGGLLIVTGGFVIAISDLL